MQLARVVGTATGTAKDPSLSGHKLLVVDLVDAHGEVGQPHQIVVDAVGAGLVDLVLVATGSAARQTASTRSAATDATAVAIIDEVTVGSN
ncbi:hypothetical protein BH23ACT5_BH23ACT5_08850 [soil metagenome]